MNIVGKIFIVLIFVMSLVFMSFAVAVYATHQNWREVVERTEPGKNGEPKGLKHQLREARDINLKLKDQHEKLHAEIKAELKARDEVVRSLKDEKDALTKDRDDLKTQRDELNEKDQVSVATLATQQKNLADLTAEVAGLRKEIRTTQEDRDKNFQTVVVLTEDVNQAKGQLNRLKERQMQLAGEVAAQTKVLKAHGLSKDTDTSGIPPQVRGKVLAINRDKMVEISLGSDDGLRVGHTLEVYRASKYLGRVEIMSTTFDRAVAKIVPGYQQGVIQKGDDVATRFKVS
jgi:hypothetical protein